MRALKKDRTKGINRGVSTPSAEMPQYTREKKSLSCTAARLLQRRYLHIYEGGGCRNSQGAAVDEGEKSLSSTGARLMQHGSRAAAVLQLAVVGKI